jgi:hypothetical protein
MMTTTPLRCRWCGGNLFSEPEPAGQTERLFCLMCSREPLVVVTATDRLEDLRGLFG